MQRVDDGRTIYNDNIWKSRRCSVNVGLAKARPNYIAHDDLATSRES